MFTKRTKTYLENLKYDPASERMHSIIPLGGIHWRDEIPDFDRFAEFPKSDQNSILRLFSIRFQIWAGQPLSDSDAAYWNRAKSQFPGCPIFQRLKLSPDDQQAQDDLQKDASQCFDAMFSGAKEVSITDVKGITKISATHRLRDEDN